MDRALWTRWLGFGKTDHRTSSEQVALLEAAKLSSWGKLYLLVLMALTTRARKGELLNLNWTDVDFVRRTAKLSITKNGKPRLLPLTRPVIEAMLPFRSVGNHLVFHTTISDVTPYEVRKQWVNALTTSRIGHCRFRDLRHCSGQVI
jgi:integrase